MTRATTTPNYRGLSRAVSTRVMQHDGSVDSRPPRARSDSTLQLPTKPFSRLDQTITLVVLAVLIAGCFLVLQPFMTAILWAGILCATCLLYTSDAADE